MALTVAMSLVYLPVKWVRPIPAQFQQCSLQYLIASLEPSARQATIRQVSSTELANDIGSLPRVLTVAMEPCFNAVVGALNNVPTPMAVLALAVDHRRVARLGREVQNIRNRGTISPQCFGSFACFGFLR